jgi:3-oxoacyl-[acyl-carrier protein] reductase
MDKLPKSNIPISEMSITITGATRGIGVGIANKLAENKAKLTLGYLNRDNEALQLRDGLLYKGVEVVLYKGDLSKPEGAKGIVDAAISRYGRVDALVSNMGPFLWREIAEMSTDEWDRMISTNLSSHFYLVHELLDGMRTQGHGNFIFAGGVGSGQVTGHPRASAYNAAKVGLAEFMKTLAIEEAGNGIRSNMVAPGIIDNGEYSDNFRVRIVNEIPLGAIGQPADIANAVEWLLSPESRYITGAVIDVSGGYNLNPR